MVPREPRHSKLSIRSDGYARRWKKRVIAPPELYGLQVLNPVRKDRLDILPYREKEGVEALAELCLYVTGILVDTSAIQVHMLQLEGRNSAISRAGRPDSSYL